MNREFDDELIDVDEESRFVSKLLSADQVIKSLPFLDTNPPYQRGEVWKNSFRQALIRSILRGTPINTVHFVKKSKLKSDLRYVLDGKQRIESLKKFVNNEFFVRIKYNGKIHKIKWENICDPKHECHPLMTHINEFQINVVIWEPMTVEEQRDVFIIINYSKSLNNDEKIYCEYFLTQKLLKFLFNNSFSPLIDNLRKEVRDDNRFSGTKMVHKVLLLAFGLDLDDNFSSRNLGYKNGRLSAKKIDTMLQQKGCDAATDIDKESINKFGLGTQFKLLNDAVDWFRRILDVKSGITKHVYDQNVIVEIVSYLIAKTQDGTINNSYVLGNLSKFHDFLTKWINHKNSEDRRTEIKAHTTGLANIKKRFDQIDEIFKSCGFDMEQKNRPISGNTRLSAELQADAYCEVNGLALTDYNRESDHVNTKAKYSGDTSVVVISDIANQNKSDLQLDELNALTDYMKKHQ